MKFVQAASQMFAQMNLAADSSKLPQRLQSLVAEATCCCQARNLFLPQKRNALIMQNDLTTFKINGIISNLIIS